MLLLLTLFASFVGIGNAARILAITPFNTKSHYIVMEPLFQELARRGHQVTVVTAFPQKPPLANKTDIDVSEQLPSMVNAFSIDRVKETMPNAWVTTHFINKLHEHTCSIIQDPRIRRIWDSKDEFDLLITEIFASDCFTYFAYKLNIPLISITTSMLMPWSAERLGLPDNPSYIPTYFTNSNPKMTLSERFYNTILLLYTKYWHLWVFSRTSQEYFEKTLGETLPPLHEVVANTSLVMVNSYHALIQSRPFPPNVVEVGGIHIKPRQPLPQDLAQMLDEAKQGAILLSFGTLVRSSSLPKSTITAFMKVFSKISQVVFIKYEDDLPEAPSNVIVRKWLPLRDMMEHENVKAVIQHGGLASTIEAVYFNKPLLGVPFFADQYNNIQYIVSRGGGLELSLETLNEDNIQHSLSELLNNPKYKEAMSRLSLQYRDRPMSGLQAAVFWTEYVLRHKGAPHLRPVSVQLPFYQYLLLDVAAILIISTSIAFFIMYYVISQMLRVVLKRKEVQSNQKQKFS